MTKARRNVTDMIVPREILLGASARDRKGKRGPVAKPNNQDGAGLHRWCKFIPRGFDSS
jgi:hypothetical protein